MSNKTNKHKGSKGKYPNYQKQDLSLRAKEYKIRAFFKIQTVHNLLYDRRPTGMTVKEFEELLVSELVNWDWYTNHMSYKMLEVAISKVTKEVSNKVTATSDEVKQSIQEQYNHPSSWNADKQYALNKIRARNTHNPSYKGRQDIL